MIKNQQIKVTKNNVVHIYINKFERFMKWKIKKKSYSEHALLMALLQLPFSMT